MSARGAAGSRVAKVREQLDAMLADMGLSSYRADQIRACAERLAAERVREMNIATLSALNHSDAVAKGDDERGGVSS